MSESPPTVYSSLLAAASTHPEFSGRQPGEDVQKHLEKIARALSEVPETVWAQLPQAAQEWYVNSIDPEDELKPVLEVPGGFPVDPPPAPGVARRRIATKVTPTVYSTLMKTAGETFAGKTDKETDNQFLSRLLRELPQDIPESVADWVNTADEAQAKNQVLPIPTGYTVNAPVAAPTPATTKSNGATPPAVEVKPVTSAIEQFTSQLEAGVVPRRRKRKVEEPVAAPAAAPEVRQIPMPFEVPAKKRGRMPRATSLTALIRDLVTKDQTIGATEIQQILAQQGMEVSESTVVTTRAGHLQAIESLRRSGWTPPAN